MSCFINRCIDSLVNKRIAVMKAQSKPRIKTSSSTMWEAVGEYIKIKRKSKKILQKDMAKELEISSSHLSNIETGKIPLSFEIACRIDDFLKTNTRIIWKLPNLDRDKGHETY